MSIGKNKKNLVGIVLSLLSIIHARPTAYNWRLALIAAARIRLSGFAAYPFVPVIYCSAILISLVCILIGLSKRGRANRLKTIELFAFPSSERP
jgi:hypothetical protein